MKKLLFLICCSLFVGFAYAAPNLTAEINMDIRANTAAAAKREATESATRAGVLQVAARYSDRAIVENLIVGADDSVLQRLVAATSIANEKSSRTAYGAKFSIIIDRGALEKWYNDNSIPNFLAAADGSTDKTIVVIELNNGVSDWMALNQMIRESGDDYGLAVRSIFRNSATAHMLEHKRQKFRQLCLNSGWSVSTREGIMRVAKY